MLPPAPFYTTGEPSAVTQELRGAVDVTGVLFDPDDGTQVYVQEMFGKDRLICCRSDELTLLSPFRFWMAQTDIPTLLAISLFVSPFTIARAIARFCSFRRSALTRTFVHLPPSVACTRNAQHLLFLAEDRHRPGPDLVWLRCFTNDPDFDPYAAGRS